MKRPMFHMEYAEDGGGAAEAAPAPVAEAGAVPPADTPSSSGESLSEGSPSPEAAAPAWANDPAFADAVADQVQAMVDARLAAMQQPQGDQQQEQQQGFDPTSLDPFSDDFGANLHAMIQGMTQQILAGVNETVAPLRESHEQQAASEQQQQINDIHHSVVQQVGELPLPADKPELHTAARDLTLRLATDLAQQEVQRYGPGQRAVEAAIQKAHLQVRDLLTASGSQAVEQYRNQLGTIAGAGQEPAAGSGGAVGAMPNDLDELGIARRFGMRQVAG